MFHHEALTNIESMTMRSRMNAKIQSSCFLYEEEGQNHARREPPLPLSKSQAPPDVLILKNERVHMQPRPRSRVVITLYEEGRPCRRHGSGRSRVRYPKPAQQRGCDRRAALFAYSQQLRQQNYRPEEESARKKVKPAGTKWKVIASRWRLPSWIRGLVRPAMRRPKGYRRVVAAEGREVDVEDRPRCCRRLTEAAHATMHGTCSYCGRHCRRLKNVLGQLPCIWKCCRSSREEADMNSWLI